MTKTNYNRRRINQIKPIYQYVRIKNQQNCTQQVYWNDLLKQSVCICGRSDMYMHLGLYLSSAQTTKFSLTSFTCSCVRHKLTSVSLTRNLVNLCRTHEQIKLVQEKVVKENLAVCAGALASCLGGSNLCSLCQSLKAQ